MHLFSNNKDKSFRTNMRFNKDKVFYNTYEILGYLD